MSVLYAYLKERDELLEIQSVQETERCYFGTNDEVHSSASGTRLSPFLEQTLTNSGAVTLQRQLSTCSRLWTRSSS